MKKMVLIGGGDIGRGNTAYETKEIDEEIVKMTNIDKPNFLFIGLASSFSDSYYDTIKKIYKTLGCETVYLKKKNIINNPDIVKEKISKANIIYIGGGDTIKLIKEIKEYKLDILLNESYDKGTILVGISAGAILLSKEGFSDSLILRNENNKHCFIEGINLNDLIICPHYNSSIEKTNELKEQINNRKVYGLENCTALKIEDDKISIIKSNSEKNVYKLSNNQEEKLN